MDMGVIIHGPGPGMQDGEDAYRSADVAGIFGELDQGLSCGMHEDAVDVRLMASSEVMELVGQREDEVEVRYSKDLRLPFGKPRFCARAVAFGTGAVETGMIGVVNGSAGFTHIDLSTQILSPARDDVLYGFSMPRRHSISESVEISLAVQTEDVGHLEHVGIETGLQVLHQMIDVSL